MSGRVEQDPPPIRLGLARGLGYGVESDPGPWGGYSLSAGTRTPPLVLDDEEALAVAVGLREAALSGVLGGEQAALSALLKLRQVLPPRVADRLGEMDSALVHTTRPNQLQTAPGMLSVLATMCRRGERVRPTGHAVELTDPPDPALLVSRSIASGVYPLYATVHLPLPMDQAVRLVPPTVGTHRPEGPKATVVDIGGPDADGIARYLLGLATPLRVLAPDEVREALVRLARKLWEDNADGPPP